MSYRFYTSTVQLDAGVRLLSAQLHDNNGALHLCHSSCSLLDAGTLTNWLSEIKTWMDNNPNDVVTILLVNSDSNSTSTIAESFTSSGIARYGYVPSSPSTAPQAWPTLQSLISANTRLITFVTPLTSQDSSAPYLLDEFNFVFENPFEVTDPSRFTCTPDRPDQVKGSIPNAISSNRMPLMNHFLDQQQAFNIETPDIGAINATNSPQTTTPGSFGQALGTCADQYGRQPTFVLVDFFDQASPIEAVDALNRVTGSVVGRTPVPAREVEGTSGAGPVAGTVNGSMVALFAALAMTVAVLL